MRGQTSTRCNTAILTLVIACIFTVAPGLVNIQKHASVPIVCGAGESPYGGSKNGAYGEKKAVTTVKEALDAFREYFAKRDVRIGEVRGKDLYFEADVRDRNNNLIDKVIIDKRTGRIRSIY